MERRLGDRWLRAFLVWTTIMAIVASVLAILAVVGFLRVADACYFQTGPCSVAGDANVALLQVAVFGIPLVWLAGLLVGVVARALQRRR